MMKKLILLITFLFSITVLVSPQEKNEMLNMKITIANKIFTASINDSETSKEFLELLPLEITMNELNQNEKYYNLPKRLSGTATVPSKILAGELMIWSSNTLVLFYEDYKTHYSYIKLGRIDNISGLKEALGRNNIKVKFEHQTNN